MIRAARLTVLILLAVRASALMAAADEYLVLPDGSGDFPTIAAAIEGATTGDTILLGDGTFSGPGNRDLDYMGKEITIRSQSGDPATCRIDCLTAGGGHRAFTFHFREWPEARLEAVTISNGDVESIGQNGGAILITNGSSPVIRDCVFFANRAENGGAIFVTGESYPTIENCRFYENVAPSFGGAVQVTDHCQVTIRGCVFWRNWGYWGGALGCDYSIVFDEQNTYVENGSAHLGVIGAYMGSVIMEGTIVAYSVNSRPVEFESGTVWLYCCDLYGNDGGDWVGGLGPQYGIEGNICADPLFCDLAAADIDLQEGSPCVPEAASHVEDECGWIGAGRLGCGSGGASPEILAAGEQVGPPSGMPSRGEAWGRRRAPAGVEEAPGGPGTDAETTGSHVTIESPNPLRSGAELRFEIPAGRQAQAARLGLYDAAGRRVRALDLGRLGPGVHGVIWDGRDDRGRRLDRGVYYVRVAVGDITRTHRTLLIP